MISISNRLYTQCRNTFLKCSEFNEDVRLSAVFVVDNLSPFRNSLPNSKSKTERVDNCIAYLLEQQFYENHFLLAAFILVLRDRYTKGTDLWNELNGLYEAANDEVNQKRLQAQIESQASNAYGELVEAAVEVAKSNAQSTANLSIKETPAEEKKEQKTEESLPPDEKKDFFISYNSHDKEWAEWIAWQLEEEGYTTIIQAWDFRPGNNFVAHMDKAAARAKRTIAVLSPDYIASQFTKPEWNAAFVQDPTGEKGLLLPIRVRDCDLKGLLQSIIYIDLVGKSGEAAKTALLAGIPFERAKPKTAPKFPTDTETKLRNKNSPSSETAVEKNKNQAKPNIDVTRKDIPNLLSQIAKIYGKNAALFLTTLSKQVTKSKPLSVNQLKEWLTVLASKPVIPEIGQDLETWLVITLEQYIRLVGVEEMPEIFSQYYEEFPPSDKHVAFLIEKAVIEIENSMLSMAICRDDNRKIQIGAKFIEESQAHLEKMENTIKAVLDLFSRYTPPDTILPEELRNERVFEAIANYAQVLDGINPHIAMRGKLANEYMNDIERNYDDLVIYAGGFIEWLKQLADRASRANRYL